jgi:hypothetical protein
MFSRHFRRWLLASIVLSSAAWTGGTAAARPRGAPHVAARPAAPSNGASTNVQGSRHGNFDETRRHRHLVGRGDLVVVPGWYGYGMENPYGFATSPNDDTANATASTSAPMNAYPSPQINFNGNRQAIDSAVSRAQAELYSSPQWASATEELQKATAEMSAATDRANALLDSRPDYLAALQQKQEAQDLAAALHERGAGMNDVLPVAQRDLEASKTLARIRRDVMANDSALLQARLRLQTAVSDGEMLRQRLRAQIVNDPQWQEAKRQLEQSR